MSKDLSLRTDSSLTFTVNTQLKEQVKWLIGLNEIMPGDRLPSANQLADLIEVNRNTVNLVYTQLRDEGYLSIHKGRGTQVLRNVRVEELATNRQVMHKLMLSIIDEATKQNISLTEFLVAGLAYALLHDRSTVEQKIAFIECGQHDHVFYRNEIKRITNHAVTMVALEELRAQGSSAMEVINNASVIVTTLNHGDEVKGLLPQVDKPLQVIGATVPMSLLLEISKLNTGSKVSFICLGQAGGDWMARHVFEAGISHIESYAIGIDNQEQLTTVIEHSDKIYASSAVFDQLKARVPNKVEMFSMVLEKSSENLLQANSQ